MNQTEHLLTCLSEECAEIQQAVAKALRFGLLDGYPGSNTNNAQDIEQEIAELFAVVDLLREQGITTQPEGARAIHAAKRHRVLEYMDYARKNGVLKD